MAIKKALLLSHDDIPIRDDIPRGNNNTYAAVIVTKSERDADRARRRRQQHEPRIFQLELLANLTGQYVGVHFNAVIAKGATFTHTVVGVRRP